MTYKASLDTLAKTITIATTILFILISVTLKTNTIITSVFLFVAYFGAFVFRPISYILTSNTVIIHRLLKNAEIDRSKIMSIELLDKEKIKGSIRTFGVGGLFGYYGKFINGKIGNMTWYATRKDGMILIKTIENKNIVITPDNPSQFLSDFNS